jgi:enterochelin esterase-like enzyme
MEPNSIFLLVLLLLATGGLLYLLVRYRHLAIRISSGVAAVVLAMASGMLLVNDYYGYYQTWSQLSTDLSGSYANYPTAPVSISTLPQPTAGRIESVQLPGKTSGINRGGLIYLPPQYFEPRYAHTDFPVLELMHGSPGSPSTWIVHLNLAATATRLIDSRLTGPMIIVMPTMNIGRDFQDCVDAPGARDDTYITQDVRADIEARFRVSTVAAEWGIGGYSSGGYCAANLATRHPTAFGAAAAMDGYFRPQDGPAAKALHFNPAAEAANDPLLTAAAAGRTGGPVPAFWLSVGTGDHGDVIAARAFAAALRGVEAVSLYQVPAAGHNFYAWEPAIPYVLRWMWTQIAPPSLRVQFPLAGGVTSTSLPLSPKTLTAARAANARRRHEAPAPSGSPAAHSGAPDIPATGVKRP